MLPDCEIKRHKQYRIEKRQKEMRHTNEQREKENGDVHVNKEGKKK
jgi:hypothetical protein